MMRPPARAIALWEIYAGVCLAVLAGLVLSVLKPSSYLAIGLLVTFSALYLAAAISIPFLYRTIRYEIDGELLLAVYGFVLHRRKTMRRDVVMTVSLFYTPLDHLFRLASVRCSGPGADLFFVSLPREEAEKLRQELMSGAFSSGKGEQ